MNSYTNEFKAQVVADLLLGLGSSQEIAEKHNMPHSTVRTWGSRLVKHSDLAQIGTDETQVKQQIGDILLQILQKNLAAQVSQLEVFADKKWLKEQNARDIGVLHGILQDKSVMLIGAFGNDKND